jgi:hypothetical protein
MASQDYAVPYSQAGYDLRFSMEVMSEPPGVYWKSVKEDHVDPSEIPTPIKRYKLYRTQQQVRAGQVDFEVSCRISPKR